MSTTPTIENSAAEGPKQQLSLYDATCIIVGIVIGAGIYETSPRIAASVDGVPQLLAVWLCGGLIALIGAVCYAELTTRYPQEGGDYVYLSKAFGRPVGFLFAWIELLIVRPGNIGALGFVFARYFYQLVHSEQAQAAAGAGNQALWQLGYAAGAVLVLTVMNILGVRSGKWTQNILTTVKVAGLLGIVVIAFLPSSTERIDAVAAPREVGLGAYFMALIFVMFTYGGWKDMACVAAEIKSPQKNLFRALVLGTATITTIYVLVNLALVGGLGFGGLVQSDAAAAQLVESRWGKWGGKAISVLICISALGAINGTLFAGSRIFYALGEAHPIYGWLGRWSPVLNSPVRALSLQTAVAVGLIVAFGLYENGFGNLVIFTAPFFSFFLFLVGVALFVLRYTDRATPLQYRVLLYPVTPVLFCLSSLALFYSSGQYVGGELWSYFQQIKSAETTSGAPKSAGLLVAAVWAMLITVSGLALALVEGKIRARREK